MKTASHKHWLISGLALVCSSAFAMALALSLSWNLFEVVVLYWVQALIIGVFQRLKIRDMVAHYVSLGASGLYANGRALLLRDDTHKGFGIIYGLFWLVEGVLLLVSYVSTAGLSLSSLLLLVAAAALFVSHLFSYRSNKASDELRPPNVETVLLLPLFRMLLPLHMFTVAVGFETDYGAGGILTWMLLKTAVDLGIHAYEHNQLPA